MRITTMLPFDDNFYLKLVAWLLQCPFYLFWFIIKLFLSKKKNEWDYIQAPQNPRVIVITGASQGIGEGLVEYYCKYCPSCEIIVMISRSIEKLEKLKQRFDSANQKKMILYAGDVTDIDEMKRILLEVHRTYGQVDILIANAGVSFRQELQQKEFDQAVNQTFVTNINGVLNTILPLIAVKGVKQIAIVSSQAAYAIATSPIYGAAKQCVLSLGYDLRRLLAKDNIAVNVISPGPVATPMLVGSHIQSLAHSVSIQEAAKIIFDGLRRNQAEIVFPAFTGIFVYVLHFLPMSITDTIASYIFHKQ